MSNRNIKQIEIVELDTINFKEEDIKTEFFNKGIYSDLSYSITKKSLYITNLNTNIVLKLKSKIGFEEIVKFSLSELRYGIESLYDYILNSSGDNKEGIFFNGGKEISYYIYKEDYLLYNPFKPLLENNISKVYGKLKNLNKDVIFRLLENGQIVKANYRLEFNSTPFIISSIEEELSNDLKNPLTVNLNLYHYFKKVLFEGANSDFKFTYIPANENRIEITSLNNLESFYLEVIYPTPSIPKLKLVPIKKGEVIMVVNDFKNYWTITKYPSNLDIELTKTIKDKSGNFILLKEDDKNFKKILKTREDIISL